MIHEIAPDYIDNQYKKAEPKEKDHICLFSNGSFLLPKKEGRITWPSYKEMEGKIENCIYLFSISEERYFLAKYKGEIPEGMEYISWRELRAYLPVKEAFAAMTAMHLAVWYESVQYCGKCGTKAVHDEKERMMHCPNCNHMMFPKISPAIIVAVIDRATDRILLTKYKGPGNQYALVAGFLEIGETLEECVRREVMEETGIRIKNITYYGSQPWGFAGNIMVGYTAELDGEDAIRLDKEELSVASWLHREEIPAVPELSSLTRSMIHRFRKGDL